MATLQLDRIFKSFGDVEVIHGVDLEIGHGEFVVFVGPSGCGKSTLLRIIAGLEQASGGHIVIDGEQVNNVPAAHRRLAMVFQSYALYPHMTVYQNLAFGLENTNTPRGEINTAVGNAARLLQIEELLARKPRQLSGGQRQRVAIGRAIVRNPRIFLFDEPLSNLDAELRVQMRVELTNLHADLGNTMIYVTHDQTEAMTMADKIVVLRDGIVEQVGAPLDLYNSPSNRFVAGFIGSPKMNFVDAQVSAVADGTISATIDGLPAMDFAVRNGKVDVGEPITIGIRPEHIREGQDGGYSIESKVNVSEQLGGESYLYVALAGGQEITVHTPGQSPARRGDRVPLVFPPERCHLFRTADGAVI